MPLSDVRRNETNILPTEANKMVLFQNITYHSKCTNDEIHTGVTMPALAFRNYKTTRRDVLEESNVMATRLQAGRSEVPIPVAAKKISPLRSVQTGSGTHPAPYSMDTGVLSRG
jgi:hypothetical protein